MRTATILVLLAASLLGLTVALAARSTPASDRPPGVEADYWFSLGRDVGIVVQPEPAPSVVQQTDEISVTFPPEPPFLEGILMARVNGKWRVISPATPAKDELKVGLLPAELGRAR